MNRSGNNSNGRNLRKKAEELLKKNPFDVFSSLSESEILKLIHELQVHQIELELQNAELKLAKEREADLAKEKYIELYDFAPSAYYTLSKEGEIIELNLAGAKMLGKELNHLKNSRFGFFVTEDTRPIFNLFLQEIFEGKSTESFEIKLLNSDNTLTYVILTGTISLNGEVGHVTAKEITDLRKREHDLIESESQIKFHVENSPMATIEWDKNFVVTRWAGESEKIFGWKKNEAIGKSILDLNMIYEDDIPIVKKTMDRLTDGVSKNVVSQNRNYTKNGKEIYCEWYNSALFNQRNEMISVFSQVLDITEKKQLVEQLRIKERALESSSNGILITDFNQPDNPVIYCNEGFEKITGYKREEIIGQNCRFMQREDRDQPGLEQIRNAIKKKKHGRAIVRNYRKDGSMFWNELSISPVTDKDGQLTHFVGIQVDSTNRIENEIELKKITSNLNLAQRIAHVGSWEWDMVLNKVKWSDEMFRVFDIDPATFDESPESILHVIHPDDFDRFTNSMKSNLLRGESPSLEYRVIHSDGSVHTINAEGRIEFNDDGIPVRNIGTAQDITERIKEMDAIQSREKQYRMMFQNMSDGFALHEIILNNEGKPCDYRFLEINSAFETLTGLREKDIIGKTTLEVLPNTEPYWIETYGKVALTGKIINFENFSSELGKFYKINAYSPEPGKFATIFHDITEQKKQEEERLASNTKQAELIRRMTDVREEERAIISREIHDQLGQSLTALKLDINWLQSISGKNPEIESKLSGMVDIVTNTIKDVQRISSELRPGILDDLGLAAAIEWYAEEFEKRTKLQVILELDELQTQVDQKDLALFRVMQEALTNVIRHAKATKIYLRLHELNEHIVLDIEDNGIGIGIERLKSNKSLGLIGMQDRIKQVGGTFDILSGDDSGTKIRICIPMEEQNLVL